MCMLAVHVATQNGQKRNLCQICRRPEASSEEADVVTKEQLYCKYSLCCVFIIYTTYGRSAKKGGRGRWGTGPATRNKHGKLRQAAAAVRAPSLSTVHPFRLPLCSQSCDVMEAVCKVARITRYRNTTAAPGVSRERSVGLCV